MSRREERHTPSASRSSSFSMRSVPTMSMSFVGAVLPGTAIGAGLYVSALALPGI